MGLSNSMPQRALLAQGSHRHRLMAHASQLGDLSSQGARTFPPQAESPPQEHFLHREVSLPPLLGVPLIEWERLEPGHDVAEPQEQRCANGNGAVGQHVVAVARDRALAARPGAGVAGPAGRA